MKVETVKKKLGNIPILEIYPEGKKNEKLPFLIYYHGWHLNKEIVMTQGQLFAAEGYRVIIPDAMNHGERKTEDSRIPSITFFQSIQTNLLEYSYIVNTYREAGLAGENIAVGGISMGGFTSFALLTHNPEIKAAGILMGTPDIKGWREMVKKNVAKVGIFLPDDYDDLTSWMDKYNLVDQPEKAKGTSLYIWHGAQDLRVPIEPAQKFVADNPDLDIQSRFDMDQEHLVTPPITRELRDFYAKHRHKLL